MSEATLTAPVTTAEAPVATAAWRAYQTAGTAAASETELIERYLPLVRNVVDRIKLNLPNHVDVDDLYSVGVTGLMAAVRRYAPEQGHTFAAYASMRIRGAVLDELRRLDWCPRRARAKGRKIKEAIATVEQRLGRPASEQEIQAELGLEAKEYQTWLEEARPVTFVSIDHTEDTGEGLGSSLHEVIADDNLVPVQTRLEREEVWQLVAQRIEELPDIQKRILAMYYHQNLRLAEIAAVFKLTESRICQIHAQAVLTLRAYIKRARNR